MCGLFGMFGNMDLTTQIDLLKELAILNRSRGKDSVGYADISSSDNTHYIDKKADDPVKFLNNFDYIGGDCVIGHTRHATMGGISDDNAHPWLIESLVGCHNGFIINDYDFYDYISHLEKEAENDGRDIRIHYPVDSQYLLHLMSEYNHLGIAEGFLNLTYWDTRNQSFYFVRHDNPLHVAVSKNKDCIVWSSEYEHLKKAIKRKDLKGFQYMRLCNGKYKITKQDGRLFSDNEPVLFDTTYQRPIRQYPIKYNRDYGSGGWTYSSGTNYRDDEYYETLFQR